MVCRIYVYNYNNIAVYKLQVQFQWIGDGRFDVDSRACCGLYILILLREKQENGNFMTNFYRIEFEFVWTEIGFDMDSMDSMRMHFVPEV